MPYHASSLPLVLIYSCCTQPSIVELLWAVWILTSFLETVL